MRFNRYPLADGLVMTYSRDFRMKVLHLRKKEELSMAEVAKRFGVGLSSVMRWSKNSVGKLTRNKPATKMDMEALKRDVEKNPDGYQYEERAKRLGVTYKKNPRASQSGSRKTLYFLPHNQ